MEQGPGDGASGAALEIRDPGPVKRRMEEEAEAHTAWLVGERMGD
jgi:hypothetical protein